MERKKEKMKNRSNLTGQYSSLNAKSLFPYFRSDLCCEAMFLKHSGWLLNIWLSLEMLEEETYKFSNNDHNINYYLYIVL